VSELGTLPSASPRGFAVLLAAAVLPVFAACGNERAPSPSGATPASSEEPSIWFLDVSTASGLDFRHCAFAGERRYRFPEIMGGGVALLDYDGDGRLDVYCVQSGDPDGPSESGANRLFRNVGGWRFEDVTEAAGVGDRGYGMGATCGDADGDGDTDLFVTNLGADVLYLNEGGGHFRDATSMAGVAGGEWSSSATFLDADGDGRLDLFVAHYVGWTPQTEQECRAPLAGSPRDYCPPLSYRAPTPATLFLNRGGARFEDVSERAGLRSAFGNGLGVVAADFDRDGRCDVFVANDGNPNQLWINRGDGTFEDRALRACCALDESGHAGAGMGVGLLDLEQDGRPDLFITHLRGEMNTLYQNLGARFADVTAAHGLGAPSKPYTGFGLAFADFDCDRDLDLYIGNGRVFLQPPILDSKRPYAEPASLYEAVEGGAWKLIQPAGGTAQAWLASCRAVAAGDLDDDGGIDLVVIAQDERAHVLRNIRAPRGHWVLLRILDEHGADALGAEVAVRSAAGTQRRIVSTSASYCASHDPRVHVGLGADAIVEEVLVRWPDGTPNGKEERFGPFPADQVHALRKGGGR
jgi:enediyne biosynthesis protein E4